MITLLNHFQITSIRYAAILVLGWQEDYFHFNVASNSQIWVMDANSENQELFSRSLQLIDTDPSWSPDGQQVIFTQKVAENGIPRVMIAPYVYEAGKYNEYRVTKDPIPMREAVFSPDGYWIAFEGWEVGEPRVYASWQPAALASSQ